MQVSSGSGRTFLGGWAADFLLGKCGTLQQACTELLVLLTTRQEIQLNYS